MIWRNKIQDDLSKQQARIRAQEEDKESEDSYRALADENYKRAAKMREEADKIKNEAFRRSFALKRDLPRKDMDHYTKLENECRALKRQLEDINQSQSDSEAITTGNQTNIDTCSKWITKLSSLSQSEDADYLNTINAMTIPRHKDEFNRPVLIENKLTLSYLDDGDEEHKALKKQVLT